jgi:hypothetical protein
MWTDFSGDGPDEEYLRRMSPPENEIPVAVPLTVLMARTGNVAVALLGLRVHTTGISFDLTVRVRPEAASAYDLDGLLWAHRRDRAPFLLGVELADGRRASNLHEGEGDGGVVFTQSSSSGGPTAVDQTWWLSPLPPQGPLRFVVRCTELGIEETATEVDAATIARAAGQVVTLWPWSPPPRYEPTSEPPDLPPDSWFAR